MNMLVLSADPSLVGTLTEISKEFAIETHHIDDLKRASNQLNGTKYAGLVLDFDTIPDPRAFISSLYQNRIEKVGVVFAVATNVGHIEKALEGGAHFVLRRPVQPHAIRKALLSAYDLLSGKQRRDFRHPANLAISLAAIPSGMTIEGSTLNVCSNGIAVATPVPLKVAETMRIALTLPNGSMVHANGVVIWSDQHGKAGLHFQCISPEMRQKLDAWLDTQFAFLNERLGYM
jgi:PilZ domain